MHTVYVNVPVLYDDLAITRKQHDRMVENMQHPLTWPTEYQDRLYSGVPRNLQGTGRLA